MDADSTYIPDFVTVRRDGNRNAVNSRAQVNEPARSSSSADYHARTAAFYANAVKDLGLTRNIPYCDASPSESNESFMSFTGIEGSDTETANDIMDCHLPTIDKDKYLVDIIKDQQTQISQLQQSIHKNLQSLMTMHTTMKKENDALRDRMSAMETQHKDSMAKQSFDKVPSPKKYASITAKQDQFQKSQQKYFGLHHTFSKQQQQDNPTTNHQPPANGMQSNFHTGANTHIHNNRPLKLSLSPHDLNGSQSFVRHQNIVPFPTHPSTQNTPNLPQHQSQAPQSDNINLHHFLNKQHADRISAVTVSEPKEFQRWYPEQRTQQQPQSEEQMRIAKLNNLVAVGAPESSSNVVNNQHDTSLRTSMSQNSDYVQVVRAVKAIGLDASEVTGVFRLGTRNGTRPLKIQCRTPAIKLAAQYLTNTLQQSYNSDLYLRHDLTLQQQQHMFNHRMPQPTWTSRAVNHSSQPAPKDLSRPPPWPTRMVPQQQKTLIGSQKAQF